MVALLLGLLLAPACSSEGPAGDAASGACQEIASACHPYGSGGGLPRECHDLGHAGDERACSEKKSACLDACPDATPPSDGGAAADGAASDGAPADPACIAYCACLAGACSAVAGYPFAAQGSRLAACAAQSAEQRTCFTRWCAKAESSKGLHDCQHAWGQLGLDECDSL